MCSSTGSRSQGYSKAGGSARSLRDRRRFFFSESLSLPLRDLSLCSTNNEVFSGSEQVSQSYTLGKFLGAGSMAVVRLASRSDGQPQAVKIISSKDEELREATRNEFRLMRAAAHSAIVRVDRILEMDEEIWICMELCEFGCVERYVRRRGVLKEPDACRLFHQLLTGVDYLHSKRTVHRDLKPANLLLTGPGLDLKITDFNCAKQVGTTALMLTERGSHHFSAPELRFGRIWNERIDIWSSGLCLHFMLCGELAFNIMDSETANFIFKNGRIPGISWNGVPDLLQNLVLQCLTVNSSDRPPVMELLLHPALAQHFRGSLVLEGSHERNKITIGGTDFVVLKSCGLLAMRGGCDFSRVRSRFVDDFLSPRSTATSPWSGSPMAHRRTRRMTSWANDPDSPGCCSAVSSSSTACRGTISGDSSLTRDDLAEDDDMSGWVAASRWRQSRSGVDLLHRLAQKHCERTMEKALDEAQTMSRNISDSSGSGAQAELEQACRADTTPDRGADRCVRRDIRSKPITRYFTVNGASFVDKSDFDQ